MQKLLLPLVLMLSTLAACGQRAPLDKFYDKYSAPGMNGDNVSIDPSFMLNASFSGDKKGDWFHKVTQVKLLLIDGKKPSAAGEWSDLSQSIQSEDLEELFSVRKGSDRVQLLSKDRKDGQKEIVFVAGGKTGGGIFIQFSGHFTSADLAQMESSLQSNNKNDDNSDGQ
jgi:hypothetical protein